MFQFLINTFTNIYVCVYMYMHVRVLYVYMLARRGQSIDQYRYRLELAVAIEFLPTAETTNLHSSSSFILYFAINKNSRNVLAPNIQISSKCSVDHRAEQAL